MPDDLLPQPFDIGVDVGGHKERYHDPYFIRNQKDAPMVHIGIVEAIKERIDLEEPILLYNPFRTQPSVKVAHHRVLGPLELAIHVIN